MKCDICGKSVSRTFLDKIKGTYIRDARGRHTVCFECQSKLKDRESIVQQLK
ncbi:hypothetical protein HY640_05345 [Candidatus Woesearchaeota archaeon]|nr:hypothetical protein [Candidatus Woesearchaeota archaeon]